MKARTILRVLIYFNRSTDMTNLSHIVKPNTAAHKISVGINGFGRFGLHLFRHWLTRYREANFSINYINDALHTTRTLAEAIKNDE